jgi:hypothetical protein
MDCFLICSYTCLEEAREGRQLDQLAIELVRLEEQADEVEVRREFTNLAEGQSFREALAEILQLLTAKALQFVNVQCVGSSPELFAVLLPQECAARHLSFPFFFTNLLDWKAICCQKYGWTDISLPDLAQYFPLHSGICSCRSAKASTSC